MRHMITAAGTLILGAMILTGCGGAGDGGTGQSKAQASAGRNNAEAPAQPSRVGGQTQGQGRHGHGKAQAEANQGQDQSQTSNERTAWVTAEDIITPAPGDWPSYGRSYAEQRFSPLDQINAKNVDQLGLAWSFPLEIKRGAEATPLAIDGVLYLTSAYSVVYALNAVTGELIWKYDPHVKRWISGKACCGVINRGVAAWKGKIYVGTLDGRLVALDAKTGEVVWSRDTIVNDDGNYSITGAPRVVPTSGDKGLVIIGNGGAELGVRGYVSAYDAETGKLVWRFFTVPSNPAMPTSQPIMDMAEDTWYGNTYWKRGGGGTVWDSIAYDPELDLLYIGVGNGSPWNICVRSNCKGDNLFLSSIVALDPDTGEYVWHYQTTPGDTWDYTATQHMILADLMINGEKTRVLMQAPKNGFFYVLNAKTGELISANNYVPVNWAKKVDPETGRPIVTETGDYSDEPELITPSPFGGHNWMPMSYNPNTGLVYIPAQYSAFLYDSVDKPESVPMPARNQWLLGLEPFQFPKSPAKTAKIAKKFHGALLAWNPVKQQAAWKVKYPAMWNGGTLTTAGNLVFQGTGMADVRAYAADTGELLWKAPVRTGVVAPPITYKVDGVQYVTFVVGYGGAFTLLLGPLAKRLPHNEPIPRVLTYKLGAEGSLPPVEKETPPLPNPPELTASAKELTTGRRLFNETCGTCHGLNAVSGGQVPDLRYLPRGLHKIFAKIVRGAFRKRGMPAFGNQLNDREIKLIHQYIIKRSHDLVESVSAQSAPRE